MEAINLNLNAEQYIRKGNVTERRRVVKDEIILSGSAMSLTKQIKQLVARRLDLVDTIANTCQCIRCSQAKEEASSELTDVDKNIAGLKALWTKATMGKVYPNK